MWRVVPVCRACHWLVWTFCALTHFPFLILKKKRNKNVLQPQFLPQITGAISNNIFSIKKKLDMEVKIRAMYSRTALRQERRWERRVFFCWCVFGTDQWGAGRAVEEGLGGGQHELVAVEEAAQRVRHQAQRALPLRIRLAGRADLRLGRAPFGQQNQKTESKSRSRQNAFLVWRISYFLPIADLSEDAAKIGFDCNERTNLHYWLERN